MFNWYIEQQYSFFFLADTHITPHFPKKTAIGLSFRFGFSTQLDIIFTFLELKGIVPLD